MYVVIACVYGHITKLNWPILSIIIWWTLFHGTSSCHVYLFQQSYLHNICTPIATNNSSSVWSSMHGLSTVSSTTLIYWNHSTTVVLGGFVIMDSICYKLLPESLRWPSLLSMIAMSSLVKAHDISHSTFLSTLCQLTTITLPVHSVTTSISPSVINHIY